MYLKTLSIINFKNYLEKELVLCPKINCFIGNNGVGKTNLLDAVYYLSFCKSYFNPIENQNINHTKDFFVIQGVYEKDDITETIYCGLKRNQKKQFKRNQKEYSRFSDHIGLIPLVMISPYDKILITEGSEERRKLINNIISQFDNEYLTEVIRYNKALIQRNKLLKDFAESRRFDPESLELWDEHLIASGTKIFNKREEFIKMYLPIFKSYYTYISGNKEDADMVYESDLHHGPFKELLPSVREKDLMLQYSSVGIHKDDLQFNLSGYPLKRVGSQGQQKSFLVALKLAQFDFINQISHHKPLLLLDDIFDKLDSLRVKKLVELVAKDTFGQIFITDTDRQRLENILKEIPIEYKIFEIENSTN